jgi:hypothetical protein
MKRYCMVIGESPWDCISQAVRLNAVIVHTSVNSLGRWFCTVEFI